MMISCHTPRNFWEQPQNYRSSTIANDYSDAPASQSQAYSLPLPLWFWCEVSVQAHNVDWSFLRLSSLTHSLTTNDHASIDEKE